MPLHGLSRVSLLIFAGVAVVGTGCSTSPMRSRLDKNFVYNCSLELISKDVAASDAERICSASHREEMMENQARAQEPRAVSVPQRAPASAVAPLPAAAVETPSK